jgi:hypothetical protein
LLGSLVEANRAGTMTVKGCDMLIKPRVYEV